MTHEAASATANMYQARLLFLQAQINPHFLYNNLACVRGMAGLGDTNSIRQMTTCVAEIYRYGSAGETTATLAEELECADSYMQIMKLRYENRYSLQLRVQSEAMDWIVPRMMLQPLIENSILHGYLDAHIHTGTVTVQADVKDNELLIVVKDEGCGFSSEAIAMLQGTSEIGQRQPHHLGIRNVRARIQLLFHDQARFEVQSNALKGTNVVITIPKN
ncbi:MAG: histidine kinase [Dehalococcoidales bacterium]|nr:histidine kinase [Dehalococcoidales bacterium]